MARNGRIDPYRTPSPPPKPDGFICEGCRFIATPPQALVVRPEDWGATVFNDCRFSSSLSPTAQLQQTPESQTP